MCLNQYLHHYRPTVDLQSSRWLNNRIITGQVNYRKTCSWQALWNSPDQDIHLFNQTYMLYKHLNIPQIQGRRRTSKSLSSHIPSKIDSQPTRIVTFSRSHQLIFLTHLLKQTKKVFIWLQGDGMKEIFWRGEIRTVQGFAHMRLQYNMLILTANTNIWVIRVSKDH